MCGIAGFIAGTATVPAADEVVRQMADRMRHRGPDDGGVWTDPARGIALSHRRLSVIDLSPAGHQPMLSASGRYAMVFNGEIYNHEDLRAELEKDAAAPAWRGHSDTETLLAGVEQWGVEETLTRSVGMFAIAIFDRATGELSLARDRLGEKPLYYGWADRSFLFASELKAFATFPGFRQDVCRESLLQFLRHGYIPAPRSIYKGVFKLEPGCLLTLRAPIPTAPVAPFRPPHQESSLTLRRWWSMSEVVQSCAAHPFTQEAEALDELEAHLRRAVKLQSLADVPLGAFLSGGIDSSLIASLMQTQSAVPVKTFTVGFEEKAFDESPFSRAVAEHLGTDHSELFVTAREAQQVIPMMPAIYDEPFADSSQIPTYLVCQAARQHVTVALSGDAGDELFGGYNRYLWASRVWEKIGWMPSAVRAGMGQAIRAVPVQHWDAVGDVFTTLARRGYAPIRVGQKAHKLAARLKEVQTLDDLYLSLVSEWPQPESLLSAPDPIREPRGALWDPLPTSGMQDGRSRMMYRDTVTYLPDDILCKVDRAAMAVSLETRVPFLDHRVVEAAWRLPLPMKIRGSQGKWALRKILYKYVPPELIERPKAGFGVPLGEWLRGPLRDWADALLEPARLRRQGYFHPAPIEAVWNEHLRGRHDWSSRLWNVLMFQAWLERNVR